MNPFRALKQILNDTKCSKQFLAEIREGIANHTDLTNRKMQEHIDLTHELIILQQELLKRMVNNDESPSFSCQEAIEGIPLLLAEKTYNTSHPDYDANLVRNYPGRIFNGENPSKNAVYQELSSMIQKQKDHLLIHDTIWKSILDKLLNEVKTIPHAEQVFERKNFIENYVATLSKRYRAHYMAGWVNLEDALFLYWLVRTLKPKTIVQTGVCNGLSSAFMVLGLIKNGGEGRIYAIDLPPIFNSNDPSWTVQSNVYGVLIPESKSSGWIVPDAYRDRIEVQCGDAKELLPGLIDQLEGIDMFYHDSDHTYHHMMFEFAEAKRKLRTGGLIIGDDISWNESLWDFADQYKVPAYNYKGSVGTAFF